MKTYVTFACDAAEWCRAECDHVTRLDCPAARPAPTIDDHSTPNLATQNTFS